ncbi:hypothetical protein Mgra_00009118 [Meloidogyne graminicola]|uniref:Protein amnionless n=1 Tax=Meloidogyne graminicola TaxID=189291 RepID=A0A8S9ZDU9_9BILA|nr:hypothetical protein Mgra_00009118 [Meloidogyne graminicola]
MGENNLNNNDNINKSQLQFILGNRIKEEKKAFFGYPNSNFFEPQFSAICSFIQCKDYSNYCSNPIKPVGQCCEQCGALLSFRQNNINFTKSIKIIKNYIKLINKFNWLPKDFGISFVRIDNNNYNSLYQLSILNKYYNQFNYNEDQFCSILWNIFKKIQNEVNNVNYFNEQKSNENLQFYFDLKIKCSKQFGYFNELILFLIIIIGIIILLILFIFYKEYKRNPSLRLFISNIRRNEYLNNNNNNIIVKWMKRRNNTNEYINIEIPVNSTNNDDNNSQNILINKLNINKESVSIFINKAFNKSNIEDIDENKQEENN